MVANPQEGWQTLSVKYSNLTLDNTGGNETKNQVNEQELRYLEWLTQIMDMRS
jgi:hypothetical protein